MAQVYWSILLVARDCSIDAFAQIGDIHDSLTNVHPTRERGIGVPLTGDVPCEGLHASKETQIDYSVSLLVLLFDITISDLRALVFPALEVQQIVLNLCRNKSYVIGDPVYVESSPGRDDDPVAFLHFEVPLEFKAGF